MIHQPHLFRFRDGEGRPALCISWCEITPFRPNPRGRELHKYAVEAQAILDAYDLAPDDEHMEMVLTAVINEWEGK